MNTNNTPNGSMSVIPLPFRKSGGGYAMTDDEMMAIWEKEQADKKAKPWAKQETPPLTVRRLADVQAEKIEWLWKPYIAIGKITVIEGDPGLGKSWLTCAIATAIAAGKGLPGTDPTEPTNTLICSAEDGLGDTIRPRLDAFGADVTRIYAVESPFILDEEGILLLEEQIAIHKPRLVIIDPLVAYFGSGVDLHRSNETREIMARMMLIARKFRCAILCVRHLAKGGASKAIYRGIGSIDITAAARSVLLVGADPNDPNKRGIVQIKNNLEKFGPALGYEIEDGKFYWTGQSDLTAEAILSFSVGYEGKEEKNARTEGEEFLEEVLASGPIPAKDVYLEASKAKISRKTLERAKSRLGVKSRKFGGKFGGDPTWYWEMPVSNNGHHPPKKSDDVQTEHRHTEESDDVQPNHTNKTLYDNELAEDSHIPATDDVQAEDRHDDCPHCGKNPCECGPMPF